MASPLSITIGQHSEAGIKDANEDSYGILIPEEPLLTTKGIAMVLADGMGSCEAPKEASESCVKTFLGDYYSTHESQTVKTSAWQILSTLNRWLYSQGQSKYGSTKGLISTFSGLVLKSATAHIFHVGDSRIYRLKGGELEQLTQDHRIWGMGEKEYLNRAMGIDLALDVDYRQVPVQTGDVFIFTSDGVHDFLTDKEIIDKIQGDDLDRCAREIVAAALKNKSHDNLTCQIVRVDHPGATDEEGHYRKLQELPFPPDLEPGMKLDGFEIVREMHASNKTQVYLALAPETGEKVVLKTPSVNFEDDPAYLELFIREEWVGKRLSNPHVLKILETKKPRKFLYSITEYVEGQNLRQWMNDNPQPDLPKVRDILEQITKGLRAFHRKEMVHQDLKPENILIDPQGTVKIIDFGSTKVAGLDEIKSTSDMPQILGTRGYSAPEYFLNEPGSKQSDLFALGVIAYEMLTGKLPYGNGFDSKRAVNRLSYESALSARPDIPYWVDGALAKATAKSPDQRHALLSEFLSDLTTPNPDYRPSETAPLLERNPLVFWKGLALGLLGLNFLLLWALLN